MAEATINLKLAPAEFDLLRSAIEDAIHEYQAFLKNQENRSADRADARQRMYLLSELQKKLS